MRTRWHTAIPFAVIVALALGACRMATPSTPVPTPTETFRVDQLKFRTPTLEFRFKHLDQCAVQFADENGLEYLPYYRASTGVPYSSLMAAWCRKAPSGWCETTEGIPGAQDFRRVRLYAYFPTRQFDDIFSLSFEATFVPATKGWTAELDLATGETAGDACVRLAYYDGASTQAAREIGLLCDATYTLPDRLDGFVARGDLPELDGLPMGDRLARVIASPEALRDYGIQQYESLLDKAQGIIEGGGLARCSEAGVAGKLVAAIGKAVPAPTPLPCTPRPLTPEETKAELDRLQSYVADRIAWLRADYAAMHAALNAAFPFAACWTSE